MDQRKIDRLFREKLDTHEVVPSSQAWEKVEKQISSRNNQRGYYWIAAAVSLIMIGWFAWPSENVKNEWLPIASEINHPKQLDFFDFTWSIPAIKQKAQMRIPQPVATIKNPDPLDKPVASIVKSEHSNIELYEPETMNESKSFVAELEEGEIFNQPISPKGDELETRVARVKITYISSSKKQTLIQPEDSSKRFKKLFAFAENLSPGEVLADLRSAKDDFFNDGLKSKKKNRASL